MTGVFDADRHVIEPPDLYFAGLDPTFRNRVEVDTALGDHHGRLFPLLDGQPTFGGSPWMREYLRTDQGKQVLVDRFGDIAEAGFDPPAMVRALDTQGIAVAALFPSFSLHVPYTDGAAPDVSLAVARAYNRWVTGYVTGHAERLHAVAVAPLHDPAGIERELRHTIAHEGARGVMIRPNPIGDRPLHHPDHDRVFSLLEDLDVPMLLHEGRGGRSTFAGDRFDTWYATHVVSHPFEMMLAVLGLVVEGVFDRHPRLRVGILESGTGWLPWWLDRIDDHHERFGPMERPDQERAPSELFAQHCVIASDSDDRFVAGTVGAVGADHVVWSSDFPHLEAKWPDGATTFAQQSGLSPDELDEVLWRSPCRLLRCRSHGGTKMDHCPDRLSERQQMAVACRTLADQGYDDKLAGHLSVRDREDGTLLVPRVGVFWGEITASDFVRIDRDGRVVEGRGELNPTIVFHLELHKARPDIRCALHNHPPYGTAWACAAELPPLYDQTGANGGGKAVVYSEYEGVVRTTDAAAALARAYGDADMAILTGHGTLVTASSVPLAFLRAMCFEHRARKAYEVRAMGLPGKPLLPEYEASAAVAADVYAEMLMANYARRLNARDPLALVDELAAVTAGAG